jgi:hypothetical protein
MAFILPDPCRGRALGLFLVFYSTLIACGDEGRPGTTIRLTAGQGTARVMFRDGLDGAWQPATLKTPTEFEASVHGPYFVTVVCTYGSTFSRTLQMGRTLDDPQDLGTFCNVPTGEHNVSGQMVQPATMVFGKTVEHALTDNWEFQFSVPSGSYDLFATSHNLLTLRRAIAVNGDLVVMPAVDLVQQGTPLADMSFSAVNATADEDLQASVRFWTADSANAELYFGPSMAAKVVPESLLTATDNQTVSVQAWRRGTGAGRAFRRPFRIGNEATYMLPTPIEGVQWASENGRLVVSWAARPEAYFLIAFVEGTTMDGTSSADNTIQLSVPFMTSTGVTHAAIDMDIPGLAPKWKVDLGQLYIREWDFQSFANGETSTVWSREGIDTTAIGGRAPRESRAGMVETPQR